MPDPTDGRAPGPKYPLLEAKGDAAPGRKPTPLRQRRRTELADNDAATATP